MIVQKEWLTIFRPKKLDIKFRNIVLHQLNLPIAHHSANAMSVVLRYIFDSSKTYSFVRSISRRFEGEAIS